MDNQQAKFAYLSGLIDGEGCLDFSTLKRKHYGTYYTPRVRIAMTDFVGAENLKRIIVETGLPYWTEEKKRTTDNPLWSDSWCFTITGYKRVEKWANALAPYSLFKKPQWNTLIRFINSRKITNPDNGYSKTKGYTEHELSLVKLIKSQKKQKASTTTR